MKPLSLLAIAAVATALCAPAGAQDRSLVIAATTSMEDSGTFDHLLPRFTAKTGISVRIVSRGSSSALTTAERGTVDVVIVNDAEALDRFVSAGHGTRRNAIMLNRFVIVGPVSDPARIKGMTDAASALREIARQRAPFVSRGDNSGNHVAEQHLWQAVNVNPKARSGSWYRETGLGMALTLQMAARLDAYALTDRATWLKQAADLSSKILVDGDRRLISPYEVAMVNPAVHPHVNVAAANAFIDWIISEDGRGAIDSHRINGELLFLPSPATTN